MAHKSKTQRAKASAARAARKEAREAEELAKATAETSDAEPKAAEKKVDEKPAKKAEAKSSEKPKEAKKKAKKPGFLREVRSEMKRVTWPTKQDVLQWSGVVVCALVFFSVFVLVLDNFIVTPVLLGVSSLGA